MVIMYKVY